MGWLLALLVAVGLGTLLRAQAGPGTGQGFALQYPAFKQDLYATTADLLPDGTTLGILGGIGFSPDGHVWAAECRFLGTRLHRYAAAAGAPIHSSTFVHAEDLIVDLRTAGPSNTPVGGCGLVNHPNGSMYSSSTAGVFELNATTGAYISGPFGPAGNALGIAVDPQTQNLVYVGADCHPAPSNPPNCTIWSIAPGAPAASATVFAQTPRPEGGFIDGIYFDPSGDHLFAAWRDEEIDSSGVVTAFNELRIFGRAGTMQPVGMASEPDGVAFHAGTGANAFVVTVNESADCKTAGNVLVGSDPTTHQCAPGDTPIGGTMTRFDFPSGDYSLVPTATAFAINGFRGDLAQVGADGCIYATQAPIEGGIIRNADAIVLGSPTVYITTANLTVDMPVEGNGIPAGARILSIDDPYQLTLTANATLDLMDVELRFGAGTRYDDNVNSFANSIVQICEPGGTGFVPPPGTPNAPTPSQGSIAGFAYVDNNHNSVMDAGDVGLANVSITLSGPGAPVTVMTGGDGSYSFTNLAASPLYSVAAADTSGFYDRWTMSPLGAGLTAGQNLAGINFGYVTGSIAGFTYKDNNNNGVMDGGDAGFGSITVTLTLPNSSTVTTVSAADGSYQFSNLLAGSYSVSAPTPVSNFNRKTTGSLTVSLGAGVSVTDQNFGYVTGSIAGFTYKDNNNNGVMDGGDAGFGSITVTLTLPNSSTVTTVSAADGSYKFSNLLAGSYSVSAPTPVSNFDRKTAGSLSVNLGAGVDVTNQNFGYVTGSIAGFAYIDANHNNVKDGAELGLSGVVITLNAPGNPTTVTAGDGSYSFINLLASATYTVAAPNTSGVFDRSTPSPLGAAIVAGQNLPGINFGYVTGSISGFAYADQNKNGIKDGSEPGLVGVPITLTLPNNSTVTTNTVAGGAYSFQNLHAGAYSVAAPSTASNLALGTPTPLAVSLGAGAVVTDKNFGYVSGAISGFAYVDSNSNGTKDTGEAGIGGVSISLGGSWTTTTAGDGSYMFTGLPGGGYTDTAPNTAGSLSLVTPSPLPVTLAPGGYVPNVNFGYKAGVAYVTYTQGGWGAVPNGNNPGMILKNNFSLVYPGGFVQIGGSPYYLKFTSAAAIQNFLPAGGTPGVLTASATNPTSSSAKVFAGQVLALQLSVDFSNKGVITAGLSARKIAPGHSMAGSTVAQVLAVANQVIAGNLSALPSGMTVSKLNDLLSDINQNYDGGTTNNGLLIQ